MANEPFEIVFPWWWSVEVIAEAEALIANINGRLADLRAIGQALAANVERAQGRGDTTRRP